MQVLNNQNNSLSDFIYTSNQEQSDYLYRIEQDIVEDEINQQEKYLEIDLIKSKMQTIRTYKLLKNNYNHIKINFKKMLLKKIVLNIELKNNFDEFNNFDFQYINNIFFELKSKGANDHFISSDLMTIILAYKLRSETIKQSDTKISLEIINFEGKNIRTEFIESLSFYSIDYIIKFNYSIDFYLENDNKENYSDTLINLIKYRYENYNIYDNRKLVLYYGEDNINCQGIIFKINKLENSYIPKINKIILEINQDKPKIFNQEDFNQIDLFEEKIVILMFDYQNRIPVKLNQLLTNNIKSINDSLCIKLPSYYQFNYFDIYFEDNFINYKIDLSIICIENITLV